MTEMSPKKIAVLIPCYNEAQTVANVIRDFRKALPNADIYVYDNNSTDDTDKKALKEGAIVRYEHKQGKGQVVRRMFQEIEADCYILVDGDSTYFGKDANKMVHDVLVDGYDMVVGDRLSSSYFIENKRHFHNFGNVLVRFLINHTFKSDIRDVMTGYRAFSRRFVKTFPVLSHGFEIETEMTIHALDKNMAVKNEVITYADRPAGSSSKLNTFADGARVIKTIMQFQCCYTPLKFFGFLAAIIGIISFYLQIPVFAEYFRTGLVQRFPTLIFAGYLMVVAIICLFAGIILQVVKRQNDQDFEFRLQETYFSKSRT